MGQPGVLDPPGCQRPAAGTQPPAAGRAALRDPVHPRGAHLHLAAPAAHAGGGVFADPGGRGAAASDRRERAQAWIIRSCFAATGSVCRKPQTPVAPERMTCACKWRFRGIELKVAVIATCGWQYIEARETEAREKVVVARRLGVG